MPSRPASCFRLPLRQLLAAECDGAGQPVRVRRRAVEDQGRRRLEDVKRDARQRQGRVDPGPVRVRTARCSPADRRCGGQGGGIGLEPQVPVLDGVRRNCRVRRCRALQDLVLARRRVAALVLALVDREPADRQMKVEILIAEPSVAAPAAVTTARTATPASPCRPAPPRPRPRRRTPPSRRTREQDPGCQRPWRLLAGNSTGPSTGLIMLPTRPGTPAPARSAASPRPRRTTAGCGRRTDADPPGTGTAPPPPPT
jgi:hypothetical protein